MSLNSKFCKLHGWVAIDFDCEGCTACEGREELCTC